MMSVSEVLTESEGAAPEKLVLLECELRMVRLRDLWALGILGFRGPGPLLRDRVFGGGGGGGRLLPLPPPLLPPRAFLACRNLSTRLVLVQLEDS